jgi:hypothetical protein
VTTIDAEVAVGDEGDDDGLDGADGTISVIDRSAPNLDHRFKTC